MSIFKEHENTEIVSFSLLGEELFNYQVQPRNHKGNVQGGAKLALQLSTW